jgi:DNA-binding IclR family transcriptional regulator
MSDTVEGRPSGKAGERAPKRARAARGQADAKPRKGIQSVEVGLRVLDVLTRADGALALKDISRLTGLSASQAHRYLASLMRQDMVLQDPTTGRYDLGKAALRVGLAALNRLDMVQVAEEGLRTLVARVSQTAMLGIWGERGPTAVRWRRGRSLIFASVGVGASFPLLQSATGHVFLAYLPASITRPIVEAELTEAAAKGVVRTEADVETMIATVRRQRYAELDDHFVPGIWALAAPVFDFQGEIVAALTLMGNASDGVEARDRARAELLSVAGETSERLGFAGYWPGAQAGQA